MENKFFFVNRKLKDITQKMELFEKKYPNYETFQIDEWILKVSSKPRLNTFLSLKNHQEHIAYGFGSYFYRSEVGKSGLKAIVKDFVDNNLNTTKIKGNFIILIWGGQNWTILKDRLGVQQLFQSNDGYCFSNSFLTLLTCTGKKYKLNQDAVDEKLTTGFLTGEETLVDGIKKVERHFPYKIDDNKISLLNYPEHSLEIDVHKNGKKKSIESNIEVLQDYFEELNDAKYNLKGDVGLSSGFDCRLILAASKNTLDIPLHIHSHNTKGVHDKEIKYARKIAEIYGADIHLVPTQKLEKAQDNLIKKTLRENVRFFDGRSARHLGSFSETYTPWYKKVSMGDADYSLNGLGGEIYRDSYFMGSRNLKWEDWAKRFLFFPLSEFSVANEQKMLDTSYRIKEKIEKRLNTNFDKADLVKTHAHYGLIKMPDSNGSLAQAYGSVSEFYLPFIEYEHVMEALKAVPYLGIGGSYQAKMITRLSPDIAAVGSHYGFSFDKLSLKYLLWSYVKTKGSVKAREKLVQKKMLDNLSNTEIKSFLLLVDKSPYLSQVKLVLQQFCPDLKFDTMVSHTTTRRIVLFLGAFFLEYQEYLEN